jgi:hypothetical protein
MKTKDELREAAARSRHNGYCPWCPNGDPCQSLGWSHDLQFTDRILDAIDLDGLLKKAQASEMVARYLDGRELHAGDWDEVYETLRLAGYELRDPTGPCGA